jgi:hypothetical protein
MLEGLQQQLDHLFLVHAPSPGGMPGNGLTRASARSFRNRQRLETASYSRLPGPAVFVMTPR